MRYQQKKLRRRGRLDQLQRATDHAEMQQGEAVIEEYLAREAEMRAQILPMAYGLMAALNIYRTATSFEA